jgi:LexA-binding, inner membrane-associated putative hydrolase
MLAEHFVYTAAVAVIAGMLSYRYFGRDCSWIVILVSYAPDLDKVLGPILSRIGFLVMFEGTTIHHGTFHTVAAMLVFGIALAFILHPFGISFFDAFFFTLLGFCAHLFEDALVYSANYMYLWPFSRQKLGLGWLPPAPFEETYNANFLNIANTEVLFIGLLLFLVAVLIRTRAEGAGWIRWYMPLRVYTALFPRPAP